MLDADIITLFLKRLERAITEVQTKYGKRILAVCYHILRNVPDAQETENDTYFGLWNSIPPQNPDNLEAYTLKIARNQALKKYEYNHAMKRNAGMISIKEIMEECEMSKSKVESILFRVRNSLKDVLTERGYLL